MCRMQRLLSQLCKSGAQHARLALDQNLNTFHKPISVFIWIYLFLIKSSTGQPLLLTDLLQNAQCHFNSLELLVHRGQHGRRNHAIHHQPIPPVISDLLKSTSTLTQAELGQLGVEPGTFPIRKWTP